MFFKLRKYGKHEVIYWNGKRWVSKPLDPSDDSWQTFDFLFDGSRIFIDFIEETVVFVDQKPIKCSMVWLSDGTKVLSPNLPKTIKDNWKDFTDGKPEGE